MGVRQVVILGAGADSRAYRFDELAGVSVFELDHPLTSRWKQDLVRAALGRLPEHVRYVAVDLARDSLDDAARYLRRLGEPFLSDLTPPDVESMLAAHGLEVVANVLGPELAQRQLAGKARVIPHSGVVYARRPGSIRRRGASGADEEWGEVEQGHDQGGDEHQRDQTDHGATHHERLLPAPGR